MRAIALLPVLLLAACQEEPVDLEADVEDQSGGEMIVEPVDPDAVPVELPETPMTNVPADQAVTDPDAADATSEAMPPEG